MLDLIEATSVCLPRLNGDGKAAVLHRLIKCRAWTDAAIALLEIELPQWKLRRLVLDDGKWLCSLSRHLSLPLELDQTADATHEVPPLAILGAFLEAQGRETATPERSQRAPHAPPAPGPAASCGTFFGAVACDNFS